MFDAPAPGKRRRGRQKTRWKDSCKRDILARKTWNIDIQNHSGDARRWKKPGKKENNITLHGWIKGQLEIVAESHHIYLFEKFV